MMVRVSGWSVGGRRRVGFDPPALHVGDELVWDLGEHVLGQSGHAEHMVPRPVHVVSEGDKLGERNGVSTLRVDENLQEPHGEIKSYN